MLVFCHMVIGAILGLMLYRRLDIRSAVPVGALGAILPDIIDKPLGHLLLQSTLDSGRIYAHTLLFLAMVTAVGAAAWRYKLTPLVLVLALGIASHLFLDAMWDNPVTLFWPALGPFIPFHYPDYFEASFIVEITSPLEWLFGASLLIILGTIYKEEMGAWGHLAVRSRSFRLPLFGLLALAGVLTVAALALSSVDAMEAPVKVMTGGCAFAAGSFLFVRERRGALL